MSVSHLFQKGQSGNPNGISSEAATLVQRGRTECARLIPALIKELKEMDMTFICSQDINAVKVRFSVIKELLDRGMGKPIQTVIDDRSADSKAAHMLTKSEMDSYLANDAVATFVSMYNRGELTEVLKELDHINASKNKDTENNKSSESIKNISQQLLAIADGHKEEDSCDNNSPNNNNVHPITPPITT